MSYLCCESQTRSITPSPVSHSSTFQLKVLNGSVVVRYLLSSFLLKYKSSATRHLKPGGKDLFTSSSDAAASAAAVSSLPWSSPVLNSTVKWNRVPRPSCTGDVSLNSPPINATSCCATANPNPVL